MSPTDAPRRRDAAKTRSLLRAAAFRRFARDGFAAAALRDIADDAGVNVALVNRYFGSKVGLFEACLEAAVDDLRRSTGTAGDALDIADAMVRLSAHSDGRANYVLLILLRSSGDEHTEEMRLGVLRDFTEQLARAAGWDPDGPDGAEALMRAQVVLAAGMGTAILRATPGLAPLATATGPELIGPLTDLVDAVLHPARRD